MISITCTQCKTVLTIDDAFAGGVCRCQHCGTIQTVPSQLKPATRPFPNVNPSAATAKSLYQNTAAARTGAATATGNSPSGLDDLARAVGSSGLTGSGLATSHATGDSGLPVTPQAQEVGEYAQAEAHEPRKKKSLVPFMIGGGVLLVIGVAVALFLALRGGHGSSSGGGESGGSGGAAFCGVPLSNATKVIYVLDRASSIQGDFDPLKAAALQSIASLGPDRKFAMILWNNGGDDVAFPAEGYRNATSDQVTQCRDATGDIVATGSSRLGGALERAIARQPSTIIIATAKTSFDEEDVRALSNLHDSTGGKIKFYTFAIGAAGENDILKLAAQATGGQYKAISSRDLRAVTP